MRFLKLGETSTNVAQRSLLPQLLTSSAPPQTHCSTHVTAQIRQCTTLRERNRTWQHSLLSLSARRRQHLGLQWSFPLVPFCITNPCGRPPCLSWPLLTGASISIIFNAGAVLGKYISTTAETKKLAGVETNRRHLWHGWVHDQLTFSL